jgi:hypothetical protein
VVEAPEDVLAILRLHLLIGRVSDPSKRGWTHVNDELVSLFKTLYETPQTQDGTRRLINDLLSLGNGQYWRLKEALR